MMLAVNIGENFWLNLNPAGGGVGITQQPQGCFDSIGNLISCILPNIYVFAGIILFILMIIGGIGVIKSANGGSEEDLKKGQQAITSALQGFLIIFVSYWIIQLVQIITGLQIFNNPTL
ncbi:MAG: hypothetical protein ABH807_00080 [Candidatus Shapirobacteria bacterium]